MIKNYTYQPQGTCSVQIDIQVDDDIVQNVTYTGGCNGNLQGIGRLVKGMTIDEVIKRLRGIRCGFKNTSCPDQLATALMQIKEDQSSKKE